MRVLLHYLMKIATVRRRLVQDNRGTAVLEMAIMTPVLLVIGLGVMEFGNLIFKRHLIEAGVREAGRYMSGMPICLDNTARDNAANLATTATIDGSGPDRVPGWSLVRANITCPLKNAIFVGGTITLRGAVGGQLTVVRIDTTVNYGTLQLGMLNVLDRLGMGFNTLSFAVSHEERFYGNR